MPTLSCARQQDGMVVGNPIVPSTAEKILPEIDYVGAGTAPLRFNRTWVSTWASASKGMRQPPTKILGSGWGHNHLGRVEVGTYDPTANTDPNNLDLSGLPFKPPLLKGQALVTLPNGAEHFFTSDGTSHNHYQVDGKPELSLIKNANGSLIYTDKNASIQYQFDAAGRMVSRTQHNGWVTKYSYNNAGQLTRITNPFGRTIELNYSAASDTGLLASISTTNGVIRYSYDNAKRLITVTYPDNSSKRYVYENSQYPNLITGAFDQNNQRLSTYGYDRLGRAISTQGAGGSGKYTVAYTQSNPAGTTQASAAVTDALGATRYYNYRTQSGNTTVTSASSAPSGHAAPIRNRSQDQQGNITTETSFTGSVTQYIWDNARKLITRITRASGRPEQQTTTYNWHPTLPVPTTVTRGKRRTTQTYDARGNVLTRTVTDTQTNTSLAWSYTYDSNNLLLTETAPGGAITQYSHDTQGNLTQIRNALGHTTQLSYDAAGRVQQVTDPNGLQTRYSYDAMGRMLSRSRTAPGNSQSATTDRFSYHPSGQLAQASLSSGLKLQYQYDTAQRLTAVTDNRGNTVRYTLDGMGNRIDTTVKDANGTTAFKQSAIINNLNRIQQLTGAGTANSPSTRLSYNADGIVTGSQTALNQSTSSTLDGLNRPTAQRLADGSSTSLDYDQNNHITQAKDPKGIATQYQVNALGQVLQTSSPDVGTIRTTYNKQGLPHISTDALGNVTTTSYDALGRITRIEHQASANSNNTNNNTDNNNSTSHKPHITSQTSTFSYDQGSHALGRLTHIQETSHMRLPKPGGGSTQQQLHTHTHYQYNGIGRIASTTQKIQANNQTISQHQTQYRYSPNGYISGITLPSGTKLDYTWHKGQIQAIAYNGKPLVGNITYTALGQAKSWQWTLPGNSQIQTIQRSFDADGRMTHSGLHQYTYDAASRITQITGKHPATQSQDIQLRYDGRNRLTQFTSAPLSSSYQYDANSNRTSAITQQTTQTGNTNTAATSTHKHTYRYKAGSNILQSILSRNQQNNNTQRNTQELAPTANGARTAIHHKTLIHDPAGRIAILSWKHQPTKNTTTNNTAQANNRFILYAHNASGLRTFKSQTQQLDQTAKATAPVTGNAWTDFWARVKAWFQNLFNIKPAQNITGISYIYDTSGNLLAEYDASNSNHHMEYVWLPTPSGIAIPLALIKNQHAFAIYSDHLHTPRIVTNAQQEIVWRWDYSGFGEIAAQATTIKQTTNPTNQAPKSLQVNLRYPGQYFDVESGLHYNWHRSYDQHTGRYTQADPIGLNGGWNRFGYANANALGFVDPMGLQAQPAVIQNPRTPRVFPPAANQSPFFQNPSAPGAPLWTRLGVGLTLLCTPGNIGQPKAACSDDPRRIRPECKSDNECNPPEGTVCFMIDRVPPSKPHYPIDGSHYHLWRMNQAPNGKCFWNSQGASRVAPPRSIPCPFRRPAR